MSLALGVPRLIVETDGGPLSLIEADALSEIRVDQVLSAPAQCELTFLDPPVEADVAGRLSPGSALRLRVPDRDEPLFVGEVTAVEHVYDPDHGREIRVRGYDLLHRLRKRQAPRVHIQVTPADLASEFVGGDGLTVDAAEEGPVWPRLIQHRQSDLELLLDVCERSGLFLTVQGDVLRLVTLEGGGAPVSLVLGETLLEARIEANGDPSCRTVSAAGWDLARAEPHSAAASEARSGRDVFAAVAPEAVGGTGSRALLDEGVTDDALALALAQAELDLRVAGEVVLRGVAAGDPRLRPGTIVEIANVDPSLSGRYVLTETHHLMGRDGGFLTEISSAPPELPARPRGAIVTAADVRSADDPDSLGRVQVVLPSFGDVETGWLEVVTVGAGGSKGMVALPDAGDRVLVMLAHEDPGQAIVLGGLYGADGPFDAGVEGGAVKRYTLRTPGGHFIRLDDDRRLIRVEDSQGSSIELAPDLIRVHAKAELQIHTDANLTIDASSNIVIEAPGQSIKIRAASIDFETA